jgi:hypothetical protein
MPLAEDQHAVSELGSGREYESLGETVRSGTARRDFHGVDTRVSQDSVERRGELTSPVTSEKPEIGSAIAEVQHKIAGLLRGPGPVRAPSGFAVIPRICTERLLTSRTKKT